MTLEVLAFGATTRRSTDVTAILQSSRPFKQLFFAENRNAERSPAGLSSANTVTYVCLFGHQTIPNICSAAIKTIAVETCRLLCGQEIVGPNLSRFPKLSCGKPAARAHRPFQPQGAL
jgi:hypothetical protein